MKTRSGPDRFFVKLLKTCFKEGSNIEDEAAKMRLDDKERRKLIDDYVELTRAAEKNNKIASAASNLMLPDFNDILSKEQTSKNAIKLLFPSSKTKENKKNTAFELKEAVRKISELGLKGKDINAQWDGNKLEKQNVT